MEILAAQPILRWFAPPELARPDLRRGAHALWIVSWPFLGIVLALLGVGVLVEPHTLARRAVTITAVGGVVLILHALSRVGRPVLASWILVTALSVIVTQRAWITGGIHAPVAVFYAIFVVMASVLIGTRGSFTTAAVCMMGAIVLTAGTLLEWVTPRPGAGSPFAAFVFAILAIGLALVVETLVAFRARRDRFSLAAVQMFVHDMRSPLQVLLMHLELLREETRDERARDVEGAIGGATMLHRMANTLLDLSRFEAGRMPVDRSLTDLSALANAVVTGMRVLQPARDIAVDTRGDVTCHCDRELMRRVVENLLSNAMKHTPVSGRVRVVISSTQDKACISVHDEGPGVPPERRARIFAPYSAYAVRSAGAESWGLGLAFCRLAVEAQGGAIRIEDARPHGSVFIVELPR